MEIFLFVPLLPEALEGNKGKEKLECKAGIWLTKTPKSFAPNYITHLMLLQ